LAKRLAQTPRENGGDEFADVLPDLHKQCQDIVKQARLEIDGKLKKKEQIWIKVRVIDWYQRKQTNIPFPQGKSLLFQEDGTSIRTFSKAGGDAGC